MKNFDSQPSSEATKKFIATFKHPPDGQCPNSQQVNTSLFQAENKTGAMILAENHQSICHCGASYQLQSVD